MATESEAGDAISSLPDETLAQILSYLPTKHAASTTTLSKRWRTPFTLMIPLFSSQHHYDFNQSYFLNPKQGERQRRKRRVEIEQSFREFVDKTLSCNKPINKFSLNYREDLHYVAQTNGWISNALERGVSELDLRIKTTRSIRPLPSGLFTSKTLVKLTLGKELCIGTESPKVFLPLLKSLSLDTVYVLDEDWDFRGDFWSVMLEGCPLLEELFLNYFYNPDEAPRQPNIISHKTLKRLTIRRRRQQIVFETPSLVYLDYSDYSTLGIEKANFLDSLVEARLDLDVWSKGRIRTFRMDNLTDAIGYMRYVDILYLSSNTVKVLCRLRDYWKYGWGNSFPRFEKLVKLSFETDMKRGWKQLTIMIDNAPKLETIVLKGLHCISYTGVCVNANVVKVLEIYGYRGSGNELRQLKRFLRQMDRLQVIKVEIDAALIDDDDKKLQITNDLLALPKCQIQFL